MLDEIKEIKLRELNEQQSLYEKKEESIKQKLNIMQRQLKELESEQSNGIAIKDKFSFIEKFITKREDYKKFKIQCKRYSELPKIISEVKIELDAEEKRVESELERSGITSNLEKTRRQISSVENARTLYDMGIKPTDAMQFLEDRGIQPVLSESDKCETLHPVNYSSKASLIGVHKTRYAPTDNIIKSAKDANADLKDVITVNGVRYDYTYISGRDTVHMAMNGEVAETDGGNWDDCKYAILIPFDDIPNEKIASATGGDTFTRGSIKLSDRTWILCPKSEVSTLKKFNPKVHVLGYEGENVQGFPGPFLTQLGYRAETINRNGGWKEIPIPYSSKYSSENIAQFIDLMKKEGIKRYTHYNSCFMENEEALSCISKVISISKLLRDKHLLTNKDDIKKIRLLTGLNGFILRKIFRGGLEEKETEPQSTKVGDVFFKAMKDNGFDISSTYQNVLKILNPFNDCIKEKEDALDKVYQQASVEEQETLDEFVSNSKYMGFEQSLTIFFSTIICETVLHSKEKVQSVNDKNEKAQQEGDTLSGKAPEGSVQSVEGVEKKDSNAPKEVESER